MSDTIKMWGATSLGIRGQKIEQNEDGSFDIPLADVAEMREVFGMTTEAPKAAAKPAPKQEEQAPLKLEAEAKEVSLSGAAGGQGGAKPKK